MKQSYRVAFVGTVQASEVALNSIIGLESTEVVAVITKKGSTFNADHRDLSGIASSHGIPWKYVRDINMPHIHEWLHERDPDVLFVSGWSQLLTAQTLRLAPLGAIGFHPALLPHNRGRHPLIWALVLGLDRTGSTFFAMDEQADRGGILSQQSVGIDPCETAASLYEKIQEAMSQQIPDFLPRYLSGELKPSLQGETGNSWRKRSREDGLIDFRMSSSAIERLIRALSQPYPGAEIQLRDERFIVWEAYPAPSDYGENHEPGKVLHVDSETHEITVKSGDGAVVLHDHTMESLPQVGAYIL
ncbi:MAG: formyltransferase family protein [Spirochaeta sp.]|jgi:methionyl-tRNA formyltransferase|nr:formyltransferase family protein [Spirochaeta sp.]